MADNNNKKLLVVLDKFQDRVSELVVVTATAKNRKAVEGAGSAATMDMKTFVSKSFSTKMFVNIFDAGSEEWLWEVNPKVAHVHARCVELWGQPKEEAEPEEEEESSEDESEPEAEPEEEEESSEDESEPEAEPEVESPKEETPKEVESSEEEPEEESNSSVFAAARQAAANRKAASKKVEKPSKPSTKKKVEKPSKKVEKSIEEESEVDEAGEETTEKSGFLVWVLACVVIAIASVSIYLTLKPGKEMETLGLTAQYVEATNRLNEAVEPAWYRWESWDRQVAAEATLAWGPYFRSLYVTGEGANPTSNSIQLYAVYLTLKVLTQQGWEPGEALRIIREDSSKVVIDALNKGNISKEDVNFIREYMMK